MWKQQHTTLCYKSSQSLRLTLIPFKIISKMRVILNSRQQRFRGNYTRQWGLDGSEPVALCAIKTCKDTEGDT